MIVTQHFLVLVFAEQVNQTYSSQGCLSYVVPTRITLILWESQNQSKVNK
uniref:Uncharacterized protein n=1 Tax=Klebsiella phage Hope TaxID=3350564 RepID=A0AB74UK21_9CAUD